MFQKENLQLVHKVKDFAVWHYKAANKADAGDARHSLGYFPKDCPMDVGDALYIQGGGVLSHHWVDCNMNEDKLTVWLLGG